jgi:hypothetical protein
MKTFLKNIWIVAILALVAASCTSETPATPEPEVSTNRVRLKITQGGVDTKAGVAPSSPIADNAALTVSGPGHLFFVNASGTVTKYVKIVENAPAGDEIAYAEISSTGSVIDDVPSSSKEVYIILNTSNVAAITSNVWTSGAVVNRQFSDVANRMVQVAELGSGGVAGIPVTGKGSLTALSDTELTATVSCYPVAARIEIGRIKAAVSSTGTIVKSFHLKGIFVNNIYEEVAIAAADPAEASLVNTKDADAYTPSYPYPTLFTTATDFANDDMIGNGYADDKFTNGKVWAYNVFPNDFEGATEATLPHIVIRLDNITVEYADGNEYTYLEPQYVTVNGYKEGSTELIKLERGFVYKFDAAGEGLKFSADNLAPEPESRSISANVTANLIGWKVKTVTPVYY